MRLLPIFISLVAGMFISLQGTLNNQIGKEYSLPIMIFTVSLVQASVVLFKIIPDPITSLGAFLQWKVWIAGLLGALIMFGVAWSVSQSGAVVTFAVIIFGQLIMSVIIDYFGLLGMEQRMMTTSRVVSLIMIGSAIILMVKGN